MSPPRFHCVGCFAPITGARMWIRREDDAGPFCSQECARDDEGRAWRTLAVIAVTALGIILAAVLAIRSLT